MNKISRRQLANFATEQLLKGQKAASLSKQLASVVIEQKEIQDTEYLLNDIAWLLEEKGKLAQANITSASELSSKLRDEVRKKVAKAAKVDAVDITVSIDKSVVGGLLVETSHRFWDKTVSRKLSQIRSQV